MKSGLATAGRWIFAVPFVVFGLFHLFNSGQMAGLVPPYFPGSGAFWVVVTGIIFLLSAASILFNRYAKEGALLLAFQLLVFILLVWLPQMSNPEAAQFATVSLLKDAALLGGALTYAGMAAHKSMPAPKMDDGGMN